MKQVISYKQAMENLGTFKKCYKGDKASEIIIEFENGTVLQSYTTIVAARCKGKLYIFPQHDCSNVTNSSVKAFTGYSVADRRKMIENGECVYVDTTIR
jgi:hypothetical protein